jgi:hypothetical protein
MERCNFVDDGSKSVEAQITSRSSLGQKVTQRNVELRYIREAQYYQLEICAVSEKFVMRRGLARDRRTKRYLEVIREKNEWWDTIVFDKS